MLEHPRLQPRSELLIGNSAEVGENAERSAKIFLSRHTDLVAPGLMELIAGREQQLAIEIYKEKRIMGYANDNRSLSPGLDLFISPAMVRRLLGLFTKNGFPFPATAVHINEYLQVMNLPSAIYSAGFGGIQFGLQASKDFNITGKYEFPFKTEYHEVVRIEGAENTLWQNANYKWNGTPKSRV